MINLEFTISKSEPSIIEYDVHPASTETPVPVPDGATGVTVWLGTDSDMLTAPLPSEGKRRARVSVDCPGDSLHEFLTGYQEDPPEGAQLAVNALRMLARYAPTGKRCKIRMEWEIEQ